MADSRNATVGLPSSPGLLRPEEFARRVVFDEAEPTPAAARWVQRIWSVTWNLPAGAEYVSSVVPHPCVSLTVERGDGRRTGRSGDGVWLTGVMTRRFDMHTSGRGGVVGVKFHAGGFTALTGRSSRQLTDQVLPATGFLPSAARLGDLPLHATTARDALCDYVTSLGGGVDERYDLVRSVLDLLTDERITRVSHLAEACGLTERTLQRLLRDYVGVGPKWLLTRQRLHDAVSRIDAGDAEPLAELATRLGWYDQNHFTRDFTDIVGVTPAAYRDRRERTGRT